MWSDHQPLIGCQRHEEPAASVVLLLSEMAPGAGLGIFVVWLLQAEHVGGSWATEAAQNNKRTGFLQQDSRPRTLGFYPQNQVRQVLVSPRSVQSSSFSSEAAGPSGFGGGLPASSYAPAVSLPAQSSVRLVKSSLVSRPDWKSTPSEKLGAPAAPQQFPWLSSAVVSGASLSGKGQNQNGLKGKGPWSSRQGTPRTSKTPPRSSTTKLSSRYGQPGSSPVKRSSHKSEAPKQSFSFHTGRPHVGLYKPGGMQTSRLSYGSSQQKPNGRIQEVQGAQNLPVPRSSSALTLVYEIPESLGGSTIIRLWKPAAQSPVRVQKPQQTPTPPPQRKSQYKLLNTQLPNVHPPSKWMRVQLPPRQRI